MSKPLLLTLAILAVGGMFIFGAEEKETRESETDDSAPPASKKPTKKPKSGRNSKGQFV